MRALHSLPAHYGHFVAFCTLGPALGVLALGLLLQPVAIDRLISAKITPDMITENANRDLAIREIRRLADGIGTAIEKGTLTRTQALSLPSDDTGFRDRLEEAAVVPGAELRPELVVAARHHWSLTARGNLAMTVLVGMVALAGMGLSLRRIRPEFRARNTVERGILWILMLAASLAILTTVGIVLSMLFETLNFFGLHSWRDFFLGPSWAPNFRGDSALSILPLLWGTLYISLTALFVAVPIGLFAAIYLSEYADARLRGIAKPLLEILAGIPTIVYGLFALLTVGPMLARLFAKDGILGVEWMTGATSVLTAGLVMGIMLIPFVSSLSDDIINAVPQSLRDGSLGLGATRSETVRQVVLPAALPGIVGAVLLAASRAIGETMIVVMGAGAVARFSLNPLDSMTTITTRIVSQLTGDTDFASPETLVAFALGLSLFALTLGLNVLALYVVRTYREQYE